MNQANRYHHGAHCTYLTQYHIIWCPKFRYPVLSDGRDVLCKNILLDVCREHSILVKAIEVMPDHIHLFVDVPHTMAPSETVRVLKSISAIRMLEGDPQLRWFYSRCKVLWSRGSFISTIGYISEETVTKYIEGQKHGRQIKTR